VAAQVSETGCPAETGLGTALTEAVRAPRAMMVVLLKETDVAPSTFMINSRKRKGETKTVD
jgi:hypothetical protein